jgi:outer membrane biosynthesis protein TonB
MARLSPITLSLAAIMVAVLSGTIFLIVHSRQPRPERVIEAEPTPEPPPPPPPARAPEPAPLPPPPPPAAPAVAIAETPAEDAQAPADDQPPPAPSRRGLLAINHNRRLQEADESVFATLALPDSTRASIRQINDEYRRRTEPSSDASGAPEVAPGDAASALKARHDALVSLLGTDSVRSFESEERAAVLRLRGKYRYEWGKQLRQ